MKKIQLTIEKDDQGNITASLYTDSGVEPSQDARKPWPEKDKVIFDADLTELNNLVLEFMALARKVLTSSK